MSSSDSLIDFLALSKPERVDLCKEWMGQEILPTAKKFGVWLGVKGYKKPSPRSLAYTISECKSSYNLQSAISLPWIIMNFAKEAVHGDNSNARVAATRELGKICGLYDNAAGGDHNALAKELRKIAKG